MTQEFRSGVLRLEDSDDAKKHISLVYFTNDKDYTVYVISAIDKVNNYSSWTQVETYDDGQEMFTCEYNKIFG